MATKYQNIAIIHVTGMKNCRMQALKQKNSNI